MNYRGAETTTDAFTTASSTNAGFVPSEEDNEPITVADLTRWFTSLFPHRVASVIRRPDAKKWLEVSRFHHLTDEEIVEALRPKAKLKRGFRFDVNTKFLVLQIPAGSSLHNANSVHELRKTLEELQVKPRHYMMDDDWYLFVYLNHEGPSKELSNYLRRWLSAQGYTLSPETLLVHPHDTYLPFPLQDGFTWLNERCQLVVRRDELSFEDALIFFLKDAGKGYVDPDHLIETFRRSGVDTSFAATEPRWENKGFDSLFGFASLLQEDETDSPALNSELVDFSAEGGNTSNVVTMRKYRLGDDIVSAVKSSKKTKTLSEVSDKELQTGTGSRLVVFDDSKVTSFSPELVPASEEPQLLLFPNRQTEKTDEPSEVQPVKKRRSDKRVRPQPTDNNPQV